MTHVGKIIIFVSVMVLLMTGCKDLTKHKEKGWTITANPKKATLTFEKEKLGKLADEIQLVLKKENNITPLSAWTIEKKEDKLVINTEEPQETTWEFSVTDTTIDVVCPHPDAHISGAAPAGERRIPARIQSQDNGIMYTQMGLVSATNIYNLFDMPTDIMIRFTKESALSRNKEDNTLMNIQVPVTEKNEVTVINDYYTEVIGLSDYQQTDFKPVYKPIADRFETAPTGWSTWYCYYMSPDQEDLMKETNALAEKLKPYGLEYVQLDAAYTRGKEANWLEWNEEMYPDGGKYWFEQVRDKGFKPGLWLNPHGANYANPSMADKYPENFFLRDSSGNLSSACCSADSTVVRMDFTNPEVIEEHTRPLFDKLVNDWGFSYIKAGGWGTWMDYYQENRENAFNPDMDSREAYRSVLGAIRDEMGDDNYILGCAMHEIGVGFDYFDGSRTGGDDYANWTGEGHWSEGMQAYFNSLFGENWLNGICWWSDPDNVMIRDPLNMDEGRTIVSSISLSGQAYMSSDFIAEFSKERLQDFLQSDYNTGWARQYPDKVKALPEEKLELYRKTMPTMPIRAMDLYPFKADATCCPEPEEFPRAMDLKVNSEAGMYDVVALYNWNDKTTEKVIDLQEDLGLKSETDYLVFDFWNQKLSGTSRIMIKEEVPAHGTKALIVKEVSETPQLLATSRHLTCAYSIQELNWNEEEKALSGTSKTVRGDQYTLFFHVPDGYEFDHTEIDSKDASHSINDNGIIEVAFSGQETPTDWKIVFE
ncbi:MAG: alpha-galactosidase [Bacteroidales bacterium]|nr:alpha-galactosidase [Bacteroidales bacterium]